MIFLEHFLSVEIFLEWKMGLEGDVLIGSLGRTV
jgi:hypothetical protein